MHGKEGDNARAEELLATLTTKLEGYERILSKQQYLGGDVRVMLLSFSNERN